MSKYEEAVAEASSLGQQMGYEAEQMANQMGVKLGAMMVDLLPDRMKLWDTLMPAEQSILLKQIRRMF